MSDGIELVGVNGQIHFDGRTVRITREGFFGRVGHGRNAKELPVRSITAVQIKPAGSMMNGYISFTVPGETARNRAGNGRTDASQDENAVIIAKKHMAVAEALADAIRDAISAPVTGAPAAADPVEQLRKLAELREAGVLSEAEFDTAKAGLLGKL